MSEDQFENRSKQLFFSQYSKVDILKRIKVLLFFGFLSVYVALLLTQTIQSIIVFSEGPTYTETLLFNQIDATFPEITICPLYSFKEEKLKVGRKIRTS